MKCNHKEKSLGFIIFVFASLLLNSETLKAQDSTAKTVSVGIILGDPIGISMKIPTGIATAYDVSFGPDYFGSPRLTIDHVWQLNNLRSKTVKAYAGTGLAVAFAKGITIFFSKEPGHESFANSEDNKFGFGARAIFGLNLIPFGTKHEFFLEAGPIIGINHLHELDFNAAIGYRHKL